MSESRKIQFTGKSSYIVSLPKQWVIDMGLKKGDQLAMTRDGATVKICPPEYEIKEHKKEDAIIQIETGEESSAIVRKLISLYFLGFTTIKIKPKRGERLNPNQRNVVKQSVRRMLMGSEITSDSSDGITVQVLVNLIELSVDGAFKRMIHLAKSMSNDALLAVRENNQELAREVINTDDEVDRFGFYIIRQLKIAIQNEHMLKEIGFRSARNCLGYRLIVKNIERAGDHAAFIAKDLLEFKKPVRLDILDKIEQMNQFCLSTLDDACLALFKEDYTLAEKTIIRTADISKYEKNVRDAIRNLDDDEEVYRVRRMTENIRRIAEYASDMSEIVLNMNIEKKVVLHKKADV